MSRAEATVRTILRAIILRKSLASPNQDAKEDGQSV
jgi:hypothetical protein